MKSAAEQIAEEFFKRRFPEKDIEFERKTGYFQEWVKRFETENPEGYMDEQSKKVFKDILECLE